MFCLEKSSYIDKINWQARKMFSYDDHNESIITLYYFYSAKIFMKI
jgi:hypothetical protein